MIFLSLIGAHKLCIVDVYPIETMRKTSADKASGGTEGQAEDEGEKASE